MDIEVWARITEIEREAGNGNSGGWQGWVKLKGSNYGVTISENKLSGYGWSDELGWIDFSRVSVNFPANLITLEPASFNLRQYSNPSQTLYATVKDQSGMRFRGK